MLANTKKIAYANEKPEYTKRQLSVIEGGQTKQKEKEKLLRKEKAFILTGVFVIFSIAFLYTFLSAQIMHQGYLINELKADISSIEGSNQRLQLEIENLRSLERIESIAVAELNMVQPDNSKITYVAMSEINPLMQKDDVMVASAAEENGVKVEVLAGKQTHPILTNIAKFLNTYFGGEVAMAATK